ncbi:spore cortex biosynthesis protein YabQ [Paenibacillus rhizoplanae]
MILAGIAMGLAYDSYRVLSQKLRFPRWLNALLDLLYWIGAALLVFRMLYAGNQGQLRFLCRSWPLSRSMDLFF